jgi:hypothetical protein
MRWPLNPSSSIGAMTSRNPPHKLREPAITSVVHFGAAGGTEPAITSVVHIGPSGGTEPMITSVVLIGAASA